VFVEVVGADEGVDSRGLGLDVLFVGDTRSMLEGRALQMDS
jgi:hypothetical protein